MAKSKKAKILRYTAIFEPAEEGGYTVIVPALPGCVTEGDTFEEAAKMAKDAIGGYLASLAKHGEPLPEEGKESFIGTKGTLKSIIRQAGLTNKEFIELLK